MKKKLIIVAILFASCIVIFSFNRRLDEIQLDGIIRENEWKNAKEYDLASGGRLLIKKNDDNELYLALIGDKKAWAHVYLSHGDTVKVLHASAALGEARYVKKNNLWWISQPFKWEMRERIYNHELQKKQEEYYKQNGWVANNNNTGSGMTLEFKLDLSRTDNKPAPVACVLIQDPLSLHYFPLSLDDHTVLPRLVQGYTPDSLRFNPTSWEKIR